MAKKKHHTVAGARPKASTWVIASALAIAALPLAAEAAGLGKVTVFSALGQPLRAELEVFATREELAGMKAQIASQEAFKQAGVDYVPTLSGIALAVDKRPNGQPIIRLTSAKPINEPFVDLLLELNWPTGRLVREYTFLLDPPEFAAKTAAAATPEIVRPVATARQSVEPRTVEERQPRSYRSRTREQVQKPLDGGGSYEVKRGETLSKIAGELRPEGVSLDQMLLGLFRANQDAFDRGNINRLKAGAILSIPDKSTLEAIPRGEAKTTIVAQSSDWGAYRRKLAAVAADVPGREEGARQQAAGRITTKVEDRAGPAAEPKDQLKVSKTDLLGAKPSPASKRTDEDLIAKDKALKDANERLASLERNVAELQRLLELKSQNLADLERQSGGKAAPVVDVRKAADAVTTPPTASAPAPGSPGTARPEAVPQPAPASAPVASAKPPEQPADSRPVDAVSRSEPETKPKLEESKTEGKAEAPQASEAPKPVEARKPQVVPPPPPEEPGFFEELLGSTSFLAAGGGIAALLAAYWFARRRRQSDGEMPLDDNSTLAPLDDSVVAKSVFRSTGGQSVDTTNSMPQTDFSQAGPGSIDTDEVDPVAEADVYMAYGRDAQAEEILLEAKQKDPGRHAIHLKLLEIYSGRKDIKPFALLATELFNATGGIGAEWEKAVVMGLQLDPGNPLFGSTRLAKVETAQSGTRSAAAPEALADTFTKPEEVLQIAAATAGVAAGYSKLRAVREEVPAQEKPAPAHLEDLDFDLGITEPGPTPPVAGKDAYLETTLAFPNTAAGDALDFDLAASLPGASLPADAGSGGNEVQLVEDASALEVTMLVAPTPQPAELSADGDLDFEFDLNPDRPVEKGWEERTLTQDDPGDSSDPGASGGDALEFDVALTESTVLGEAMQHAVFDMSSISLDLGSTDVLSRAETEVVSASPAFSFDDEQEDTLVNPDFSMEQTDTGSGSSFGSLTDMTVAPDISANEEVATKIDLAKAYQEMGDLEGARELLQEVVNEGDPAQRGTALALLAGLHE